MCEKQGRKGQEDFFTKMESGKRPLPSAKMKGPAISELLFSTVSQLKIQPWYGVLVKAEIPPAVDGVGKGLLTTSPSWMTG
ncbi:hypothetical protein NPIL_565831 [Nephila pilipes]|uniref:Uncharacterized protein n=1 Tax=Nephila pilipes TaxID=299642 RepID=A0A8X6PN94_NEPPI|nr:hypothetical protein NPIL_565831 [Nephila pilipes]